MRLPITHNMVSMQDNASAITRESHIPSSPITNGRVNTAIVWNTSVRIKDIIPLVKPSFNAVKNDEPKMPKPENRKEKPYMKKAYLVISYKDWSYPTNIDDIGPRSNSDNKNISSENTPTITVLFLSKLFNSEWFCAP